MSSTIASDLKRLIHDDIKGLREVMGRTLTGEHINDMTAFQDAAIEFIVSVLDIDKITGPEHLQRCASRAANDYRQILSIILGP